MRKLSGMTIPALKPRALSTSPDSNAQNKRGSHEPDETPSKAASAYGQEQAPESQLCLQRALQPTKVSLLSALQHKTDSCLFGSSVCDSSEHFHGYLSPLLDSPGSPLRADPTSYSSLCPLPISRQTRALNAGNAPHPWMNQSPGKMNRGEVFSESEVGGPQTSACIRITQRAF